MTISLSHRSRTTVISLAAAGVLIAQAVVVLLPLSGIRTHTWYWPFIDYPMYAKPHYEGDRVKVSDPLVVRFADGSESEVDAASLGLNFWHLMNLTRDLKEGDPNAAERLIRAHPRGAEIVEARIYEYPIQVTRNGAAPLEEKLLMSIRLGGTAD